MTIVFLKLAGIVWAVMKNNGTGLGRLWECLELAGNIGAVIKNDVIFFAVPFTGFSGK